MIISYSKYTAFLTNPEKFRLYYILGLVPEGDDTPTRMNMGRRRGTVFHALAEAKANDEYATTRKDLVAAHGLELIERCEDMLEVVPDLGPLFMVEHQFETPIGDGKHSIMGFIDHGYTVDGTRRLGDYKTTKGSRTKKELQDYFGTLETSAQSHFYLKAAAAAGEQMDMMTFHVIADRKSKDHKPTYSPIDVHVGPAEVERTMSMVYAACETIGFLTDVYGTDKPWPHSNNWPCSGDKFFCGYQTICGRGIPVGCTPPGFTQRFKHLIQLED